MDVRRSLGLGAALLAVLGASAGVRAEVIEEIVAKVNDEIITKSEFEAAEQESVAEAYRRLSGDELDREVTRMREGLLREMINRKVLLHRALRMYDADKLGQALLDSFIEQQGISGRQELARLLVSENMTEDEFRRRLIELYAPREVENYEVRNRISVSDAEVLEAYESETERFRVPAEAQIREIVILAASRGREAARALAEEARARATAEGADFAAVASEMSDAGTKGQGGLLGTVRRGDLAPALETQAFTLPVGEVSAPLETEYGYHIVKVDSRTDDSRQAFDVVKDEIREEIWGRRYRDAHREFMKKAWAEAEIYVAPKYAARLSNP